MNNKLIFPTFYQTYIDKVTGDPVDLLSEQREQLPNFIVANKHRLSYAYGPDKWTIAQVVGHIIDTEIVFGYRMLRIARGDAHTSLPGFDQNVFMEGADFSSLKGEDLSNWFVAQRAATLCTIKSISDIALDRLGLIGDQDVNARSVLYMVAGHTQHHIDILQSRYL